MNNPELSYLCTPFYVHVHALLTYICTRPARFKTTKNISLPHVSPAYLQRISRVSPAYLIAYGTALPLSPRAPNLPVHPPPPPPPPAPPSRW